MPTTLESVVTKYLRSGSPAQRTREEYGTTVRKWSRWGGAVPLENLGRKEIREFLDWVLGGGTIRFRLVVTGALLSSSSSTMELTPEPFGRLCRFTNQFSGGTCRGNDTRPTARLRSHVPGAGFSIVA